MNMMIWALASIALACAGAATGFAATRAAYRSRLREAGDRVKGVLRAQSHVHATLKQAQRRIELLSQELEQLRRQRRPVSALRVMPSPEPEAEAARPMPTHFADTQPMVLDAQALQH